MIFPSFEILPCGREEFIKMHLDISGRDISSNRSSFEKTLRFQAHFNGKLVGVFSLGLGPDFLTVKVTDESWETIFGHQRKSDYIEVLAVSIAPEFRGTWVSVIFWFALTKKLIQQNRKFVFFASNKPKIQKMYEGAGVKPVYVSTLVIYGEVAEFRVYQYQIWQAFFRLTRALIVRSIRRIWGERRVLLRE